MAGSFPSSQYPAICHCWRAILSKYVMQIFHVGRSTQAAVLLFAVLTVSIATPRLEAQDTPRPKPAPTDTAPLVTDRPDFTEGAVLVPRGTFQFEMGTTYQRHDVGYAVSGPELLLRYGLRRRVELRFGLPDYARESLPNNIASGFGSTYLGAKLALGSFRGVGEVAIIPAVSVSLGNGTFTSRSVDPALKMAGHVGRSFADEFWAMDKRRHRTVRGPSADGIFWTRPHAARCNVPGVCRKLCARDAARSCGTYRHRRRDWFVETSGRAWWLVIER